MKKSAILKVMAIAVWMVLVIGPIQAAELHVPSQYGTIQAAIDIAVDGDMVIVTDGVYTGLGNKMLDFGGRAITLCSANGPEVTIIDCENDGRGVTFMAGEDQNTVLCGLSIINGKASDRGGAVLCSESSPTIENCIFRNNDASTQGGAVSLIQSQALISNCLFENNKGAASGGALWSSKSPAIIENCEFIENSCYNFSADGGAILNMGVPGPTFFNCLFINNESGDNGGGGAIRNFRTSLTIMNCTFVGNHSDYYGGALDNSPDCTINIMDSIFWGNDSRKGGDEIYNGDSIVTISNCDIRGGLYGANIKNTNSTLIDDGGNINAGPLFITGPKGDYYLSQIIAGQGSDSPCVDAGSDTAFSLGMDLYSTRTDELADEGMVDIGYHYPALEITAIDYAIKEILATIDKKEAAIAQVESAIEKEVAAYDVLEDVLESGDYGELSKAEIIKAKQKIHSAMQHEEQSLHQLKKSVEKLYSALESLGWTPPRNS